MAINSETSIWHYCDLAKYIGLLSRGLFFALPSALRRTDPWEGSCGELDFVDSLDATVHASSDGVEKWRSARSVRYDQQDAYGISCWHESTTESAALWKLYAPLGLGVAVKSSPAKILAALDKRLVEARQIDYRGHQTRHLGDDPLVLLSTKRPEFQHEQEIRFFATLTPDEKTAIMSFYSKIENHGYTRRIRPGNKGPLITNLGGYSVSDNTCLDRCAPTGVHLPTNANILIDHVYLAPACAYSLRRAVLDITKRFGLDRKVIKEAGFDLAPFDRVEFE